MPVYYLHLRMPDGNLEPDQLGIQLADDGEALRVALRLTGKLAAAPDDKIPAAVEIHDAEGWLVEAVPVVPR